MKDDKDKYIPIVTKVSKHAAERLEALAKKRGMTKYEIIQMSVDTLIRYMDDRHNLTEEMEQAMNIFEHMIGWENALNLADPTVNREIAEAVYIMQDPEGKKKGYRAVMKTLRLTVKGLEQIFRTNGNQKEGKRGYACIRQNRY